MDIAKELKNILARNSRVEADKAWETSLCRRLSIALITYIVAVAVMYSIGASNILLNAIIPVLGFLLSTLSLPALKSWWVEKRWEPILSKRRK